MVEVKMDKVDPACKIRMAQKKKANGLKRIEQIKSFENHRIGSNRIHGFARRIHGYMIP
jgi:hypothetical protein